MNINMPLNVTLKLLRDGEIYTLDAASTATALLMSKKYLLEEKEKLDMKAKIISNPGLFVSKKKKEKLQSLLADVQEKQKETDILLNKIEKTIEDMGVQLE